MHQLVMGRVHVDHINRNTLDNRKGNLRDGTKKVQYANRGPAKGRKYKGITWIEEKRKWRAAIGTGNRRSKFLGHFETAEEAARAYDQAALQLWGDVGMFYLNFPS